MNSLNAVLFSVSIFLIGNSKKSIQNIKNNVTTGMYIRYDIYE